MSKILDSLFLGAYSDAKNKVFLKKNNITHILTVGVELQTVYPDAYKYLHIPAYDSPGYKLNLFFDQITDFIHKAINEEQGTVLVHCYWGISRSTTSVLAYLIKHHNMTPAKARRFVLAKRSVIFPNSGFLRQLDIFAKKLEVLESKTMKINAENGLNTMRVESMGMDKLSPIGLKSLTNSWSGQVKEDGKVEEKKKVNVNYHCRNCALKLFSTQDVVHNAEKSANKLCNGVYLKYLPWMGEIKTTNAKIFCPNKKCITVIGSANKNGGKCMCDTHIEKIFAIYLSATVTAKPKPLEKSK